MIIFSTQDLEIVGQLLGIKTFINTMVAYFRFPEVEHQVQLFKVIVINKASKKESGDSYK